MADPARRGNRRAPAGGGSIARGSALRRRRFGWLVAVATAAAVVPATAARATAAAGTAAADTTEAAPVGADRHGSAPVTQPDRLGPSIAVAGSGEWLIAFHA